MKKRMIAEVALVMGSDSDWSCLKPAADICQEFGVAVEVRVLSAHRTPLEMVRFARQAHRKGTRVIIAGAGGSAHLPGMVASLTPLPVIGVPIPSPNLAGVDALLSILQMPAGVPVATVAIGGGRNAGLLALQILATRNGDLSQKISDFKRRLRAESRGKDRKIRAEASLYLNF